MSDILDLAHELAGDLHAVGAMDKVTLRMVGELRMPERRTFTAADLALTKTSLQKARARQFETLDAKLGLLAAVGDYGLPADFVARENAELAALDAGSVQRLAREYLRDERSYKIVVVPEAQPSSGTPAAK